MSPLIDSSTSPSSTSRPATPIAAAPMPVAPSSGIEALANTELRALALKSAKAHDSATCAPLLEEMQRRGMDVITVTNVLYPPVPHGIYVAARPMNHPANKKRRKGHV